MPLVSTTRPFAFNGNGYLIEIVLSDRVLSVQALTSDHQPCGFEYSFALPQDYYLDALLESGGVKALIEQAKLDVTEDRWQKDLATLEEAVVAQWINHSDDWQSHPGFIVHTDVFDRKRLNFDSLAVS